MNPDPRPDYKKLDRWVNRLEHAEKAGANVSFTYLFDPLRSSSEQWESAVRDLALYTRLSGSSDVTCF